ncbi:saxitoxin and tetrodotoxin-binding protein 1-like [Cheilinus undulatus]|uniref:saxitoxin and tetrodotoxin-binding protein 1-like n=1 Tax=Cheilinus undulatus TaxID=241271 RepID=UPI001BD4B0F7|nr:saxitoxin and tetrodotoxin-binding protein 1-like [Cheilinus undulatus]
MDVFVRLVLLALLALSSNAAPGHEACNLMKKVTEEDMRMLIKSRWVLVEAFSDFEYGVALLSNASSSVVEMSLNSDNKTFLFVERNIVNGKCLTYYVNMSAPDPETSNHTLHLLGPGVQDLDGHVTPYDDQGKTDTYLTCPHCLTIIYNMVFDGIQGRMLLIYRQEGKHQDAEELRAAQSSHRVTAECLNFIVTKNFKYDGTADFCEKKKEEESEG